MSATEQEVLETEGTEDPAPDPAADRATEQRRIDDEFKAAAGERRRIQETASQLLAAAESLKAQAKAKPPEAEEKPPAREDFTSEVEYLEAKIEFSKSDVQKRIDTAVERALAMRGDSLAQETIKAKMQQSASRGEELYPGFSDTIEKVPAMPQAALTAWQELDEPEHVAHYFGTHREEALKIGRMTPGRAAHAVMALDEKLAQERAGKREAAPEFGPPPGGKPKQSGIRPDMDMDSYAKARIQEKLKILKG
jgi:hypothetical protein